MKLDCAGKGKYNWAKETRIHYHFFCVDVLAAIKPTRRTSGPCLAGSTCELDKLSVYRLFFLDSIIDWTIMMSSTALFDRRKRQILPGALCKSTNGIKYRVCRFIVVLWTILTCIVLAQSNQSFQRALLSAHQPSSAHISGRHGNVMPSTCGLV